MTRNQKITLGILGGGAVLGLGILALRSSPALAATTSPPPNTMKKRFLVNVDRVPVYAPLVFTGREEPNFNDVVELVNKGTIFSTDVRVSRVGDFTWGWLGDLDKDPMTAEPGWIQTKFLTEAP